MNERPRRTRPRGRKAKDAYTDELDAIVREVVDDMLNGRWGPLRHMELCKRHKASSSAVSSYAAQAARFIRFLRGPTEDFRERILANLDFAGRFALELDRPDVKAFISAQVEQARLLRLDREDEATEAVPVDQLAAALRALGHEVILHESKASSGDGGDDESGDGDDEPTERPAK